jgi:hypothetical protein
MARKEPRFERQAISWTRTHSEQLRREFLLVAGLLAIGFGVWGAIQISGHDSSTNVTTYPDVIVHSTPKPAGTVTPSPGATATITHTHTHTHTHTPKPGPKGNKTSPSPALVVTRPSPVSEIVTDTGKAAVSASVVTTALGIGGVLLLVYVFYTRISKIVLPGGAEIDLLDPAVPPAVASKVNEMDLTEAQKEVLVDAVLKKLRHDARLTRTVVVPDPTTVPGHIVAIDPITYDGPTIAATVALNRAV